ncbi:predicted protein [Nematostella vectensis]|uniref:Vezatin n=1 Tax=Nematostella vectensis TaxID=45351 RepID=A7REW6_NEMVE|nr:predicted protein [Nematostella vectensis]|eukprot:XP_001641926.1 predicted protein [Nematostella vectensis]
MGNFQTQENVTKYKDSKCHDNACFISKKIYQLKKILLSPYMRWQADQIVQFKKDCASLVINSGTLNEDDFEFLLRFDPELFNADDKDCENKQTDASLTKALPLFFGVTSHSGMYLFAMFVALAALAFNPITYSHFTKPLVYTLTILAVTLVVLVVSFFTVTYLKFRISKQYWRYIGILREYCSNIRSLLLLVRKSINMIQEVELICRGQMLVGSGMPKGMLSTSLNDNFENVIYPKLRQCMFDKLSNIHEQTSKAAKNLNENLAQFPELDSMFTSMSVAPMESLFVQEASLSTHHLKNLLAIAASQQSEFLSRYLLLLSDQAYGDMEERSVQIELMSKMNTVFIEPACTIAQALASLQRSYHAHKVAMNFSGEGDPSPKQQHLAPQSNWIPFSTAIHSLELHLKLGITKVNTLNEIIKDYLEKERLMDEELVHTELCNEMKVLKGEIESVMCCWEEGYHRLSSVSGKHDSVSKNNIPPHISEDADVASQVISLVSPDSMIEEGDYVLEAYTDSYDDVIIDQPILTREDLEKESRAREESRHLLKELKNVLLTKSKDPLISHEGFVDPIKKHDSNKNARESLKIETCKQESTDKGPFRSSGVTETTPAKQAIDQDASWQPAMVPTSPKYSNEQSSMAFSVAAMAAVRSRQMGMMEENFGSDDSDMSD